MPSSGHKAEHQRTVILLLSSLIARTNFIEAGCCCPLFVVWILPYILFHSLLFLLVHITSALCICSFEAIFCSHLFHIPSDLFHGLVAPTVKKFFRISRCPCLGTTFRAPVAALVALALVSCCARAGFTRCSSSPPRPARTTPLPLCPFRR